MPWLGRNDRAHTATPVHPYGSPCDEGSLWASRTNHPEIVAPSTPTTCPKAEAIVKGSPAAPANGAQWWDCDRRLAQAPGLTPPILMLHFLSSFLLLSAIVPEAQAAAFQCGQASHYGIGDGYHGQRTASGQRFNAHAMTAAHPSLPLGSKVLVKNRDNGKTVLVTINDRGPYAGGRVLDLSYGSFARIASPSQGVANVCMSRA